MKIPIGDFVEIKKLRSTLAKQFDCDVHHAPVASDMQSAKLLGKGGLDIINRIEYKGTFESEIGSAYEEYKTGLVGFGLTDKTILSKNRKHG